MTTLREQRRHHFEVNSLQDERKFKMEDRDSTNSSAMQAYTPVDDGWNSPVDGAGRQIRGTLISFADKQWFTGSGKYKEEIPTATRLVVVEARRGWKHWRDHEVIEFRQEVDGRYPRRDELGDNDETTWECGPDGSPADPWQDSREAVMLNPDDYSVYTYCTSSGGGRRAVDQLAGSMQHASRFRPGKHPIVELQWRRMETRFSMKSKPHLQIVGWFPPDEQAPRIVNDLNDKIPDLSK
jgi:hypothetical protein